MTIPLPVLPPEPPATADAATVAAWWQRVDVLLRVYALAQHLEISTESTAAQNARAQAEVKVASAGTDAATAQRAMAAALLATDRPAPATDADLLRWMVASAIESGLRGSAVIAEARLQLAAYRKATAPIFVMPA